jgi:hypothetical protein
MRWASGDGISPSVAEYALARCDTVRLALVWRCRVRADDLSTEGLRAFPAGFYELRRGGTAQCMAMPGWVRRGTVCQGMVSFGNSCDSSTGGFGSLCCSHSGADGARHGSIRRVRVRLVAAWQIRLRRGKG